MTRLVLGTVVVLVVAGCTTGSGPTPSSPAGASPTRGSAVPATDVAASVEEDDALRLVALGDSYTIGTGVRPRERWPNQLVRALRPDLHVILSANLARNGATSEDVVMEQLPQLRTLRPDLVSVLVGVNDVVVGTDPEVYRQNIRAILDAILERLPPERVFVITTPDYTLTPRGGDYGDREQQRAGIRAVNEIVTSEATARGMHVVDISAVSDRVEEDPSLLAEDDLHPSAKQYAGWVELIARSVRAALAAG